MNKIQTNNSQNTQRAEQREADPENYKTPEAIGLDSYNLPIVSMDTTQPLPLEIINSPRFPMYKTMPSSLPTDSISDLDEEDLKTLEKIR